MEKEVRFEKSESFERLMECIRTGNAMEIFGKYPFVEVREKCLREMNKLPINEDIANWAEVAIVDLLQQEDELAEKVVEWYLFLSSHNCWSDVDIRAIKFVITLSGKSNYLSVNKISKLVIGALSSIRTYYFPDFRELFYSKIPLLKKFIGKLLDQIAPESEYRYREEEWYCVERAIKLIIWVEDYTFLPAIEKLLMFYDQGKMKTKAFPDYVIVQHIALLNFAKQILIEEKLAV